LRYRASRRDLLGVVVARVPQTRRSAGGVEQIKGPVAMTGLFGLA